MNFYISLLGFRCMFLQQSCFYSISLNFNSSYKKRACCGIRICQVWQRGFLNAASGPTSSRCQEIIKSCFLLVCSYLYFSKSSRPISSETVWSSRGKWMIITLLKDSSSQDKVMFRCNIRANKQKQNTNRFNLLWLVLDLNGFSICNDLEKL